MCSLLVHMWRIFSSPPICILPIIICLCLRVVLTTNDLPMWWCVLAPVAAHRSTHPSLPIILYISDSGGLIERMGATGADIISLDSCVDMADALRRLPENTVVQGNMDPGSLFGSKEYITDRIMDTMRKAGGRRHIMNLGHGVMVGTPEDNVEHWFHTCKEARLP